MNYNKNISVTPNHLPARLYAIVEAWRRISGDIIENALDFGVIDHRTILTARHGKGYDPDSWDLLFEVYYQNGIPNVLAAAFASGRDNDQVVREVLEDDQDLEILIESVEDNPLVKAAVAAYDALTDFEDPIAAYDAAHRVAMEIMGNSVDAADAVRIAQRAQEFLKRWEP